MGFIMALSYMSVLCLDHIHLTTLLFHSQGSLSSSLLACLWFCFVLFFGLLQERWERGDFSDMSTLLVAIPLKKMSQKERKEEKMSSPHSAAVD